MKSTTSKHLQSQQTELLGGNPIVSFHALGRPYLMDPIIYLSPLYLSTCSFHCNSSSNNHPLPPSALLHTIYFPFFLAECLHRLSYDPVGGLFFLCYHQQLFLTNRSEPWRVNKCIFQSAMLLRWSRVSRVVAVALSYCTGFDKNTEGSTIFELFFYRANKLVIEIRYRLDTKV